MPDSTARPWTVGWWLVAATSLAYVTLLWPVWLPAPFGFDLDAGWQIALHDAFAHGRQWGADVVFTYGPWGFAATQRGLPATYWQALSVRLLIGTAVWAALLGDVRRSVHSTAGGAFLLAATLGLAATLSVSTDPMCLLVPTLVLVPALAARPGRPLGVTLLLLAALGAVALMKFTFLIAAAIAVVAVGWDDVRAGKPPWVPVAFVASVVAWWLAAGQSFAGLPTWLVRSTWIAAGYTEAMAIDGPPAQTIAGIVGAVALVALAAITIARTRAVFSWPLLIAWSLLIHLAVKGSLVRHDGHVLFLATALPVDAALGMTAAWPTRARRAATACAAIAAVCAQVLIVSTPREWLPVPYWRFVGERVASLPALAGVAAGVLRGTAPPIPDHDRAMAHIRTLFPLDPLPETLDVYPFELAIPIAHGVRAVPRPVLQGYSAYTPPLARLDARALTLPTGPDTVLFRLDTIDDRWPALDDGPSWIELWSRFDPSATSGAFLRLDRRPVPRSPSLTPIEQREVGWNEWIEVSADAPLVWARIDAPPTLVGWLCTLLWKVAPPELVVDAGDGPHAWRLVPRMAAAGFLLSPRVTDTKQWAAIGWPAPGTPAPPRVVRFMLHRRAAAAMYAPSITVELSRLDR